MFGRFRIVHWLAHGGGGTVYEAVQPGALGFSKRVALKVFRDDQPTSSGHRLRSLSREARLGGLLNHVNIVDAIDCGMVDGSHYLAMEYVEGVSLGELLDFGVASARFEGVETTPTRRITGTPRYMSPEQAQADRYLDRRSDLYSLGALLFELLTGEHLVPGRSVSEVVRKVAREDPRHRLHLAEKRIPGIMPVLARLLSPRPGARYPTAGRGPGAGPAAAALPRRRSPRAAGDRPGRRGGAPAGATGAAGAAQGRGGHGRDPAARANTRPNLLWINLWVLWENAPGVIATDARCTDRAMMPWGGSWWTAAAPFAAPRRSSSTRSTAGRRRTRCSC